MAGFDADVLYSLYLFRWRVTLPTTIAIVIALFVYYLGGRTHLPGVFAFAMLLPVTCRPVCAANSELLAS